MQIDYECARCNRFVKASLFRAPFKNGTGYHFRLDCTECKEKSRNYFIKFISPGELKSLGINPRDVGERRKVQEHKVTLEMGVE